MLNVIVLWFVDIMLLRHVNLTVLRYVIVNALTDLRSPQHVNAMYVAKKVKLWRR